MKAKFTGIALSLMAIWGGSALAGIPFHDDFSGGTDVAWSHFDLIGGTSYSIASGRYEIQSVPLPPLTTLAATGAAITDSAVNPASYTDGIFRTDFRFNNAETNIVLIARAIDVTQGYSFSLNNANTTRNFIGMGVLADGDIGPDLDFLFTENVDYVAEVGLSGPNISLKVWAALDPEPGSPQLTWMDSTYTAGGLTGLAVYNQYVDGTGGALAASFDNVSFVPEPSGVALLLCGAALFARRVR